MQVSFELCDDGVKQTCRKRISNLLFQEPVARDLDLLLSELAL
ncbi:MULTISPECIES: hypothetical protein [unclassified Bradyrhizobium]|nr:MULTISPECIES: hypothetical protein [unclassified Bradyrhizobium]